MTLNWLASSCAFICEVMVARMVLLVVFVSLSTCFFAALITEPAMIALVDFDECEEIVAIVEQFLHAIARARVAWVKLADENVLDAFLQYQDSIVIALPMIVCLEGQFVNFVKVLLLGHGSCHVACFHHGDAVCTVMLY
jgi:hypothetical protein